MSKFKHQKYTWSKPFMSVRHCWELVGPNGALHFTANLTTGYGTSCGLEFHSLSGDGAPDHLSCHLTGGRCWHDGTSLYADENVWPVIEPMLRHGEHEAIFRVLEQEYERHFERWAAR